MSIDKTLLVLIHFDGNGDLLNDKELNDLRFSTLKKLLFEHASKEHGLLIVSDPIHNDRKVTYRLKNTLRQLKAQQNEINYTEWLEVPEKETDIKWIKKQFEEKGYNVKNVILCGMNTAGCVLGTLDYSALRWAEQGHYTQILLSACGDYEASGVGPERYMNSFTNLYKKIKESGQMAMIDLVTDVDDLLYISDGKPMVISDRVPKRSHLI
tara:strand:- start:237 stop:869 length:633 start_codon:yes stop_codon:yes gene_type:complete